MKAEAADAYHTRFDDYVMIGAGGFLLLIGVGFAAQNWGWWDETTN